MPERMTPLERVLAASNLEMPDRVPVLPLCHEFPIKYAGFKFSDCISDSDRFVNAQLKCFRDFGYDAVWDLTGVTAVAEAMGCKLEYFEDDVPTIVEPLIKSQRDIEKLDGRNILGKGKIPFIMETISKLRKAVGPDVPIISWVGAPFRIASLMRGMQPLYLEIVEDLDFVKKLLDLLVQPCIDYGQAALEHGANIIRITEPMAGGSVISKKHYKEVSYPYTKKLIAAYQAHGGKVLYHLCGDWSDRLDLVLELKADIWHLGPFSLEQTYAGYAGEVCLMGNLKSVATLLQGTPEEIEREAWQCIQTAGGKGAYILGADCLIPRDIPIPNFKTFVDCARKYGNYSHLGQ